MKNFFYFCMFSLIASLYAEEFTELLPSTPSSLTSSPWYDQGESMRTIDSRPFKSVNVATALSLVPGLGHAYLGDMQTASALFGSFGLEAGASLNSNIAPITATFALNTWFYGIYAGYRDARIYNDQKGFRYKMPQDSLADLIKAPFNPAVISKPEVWGAVSGMLVAGGLLSLLSHSLDVSAPQLSTTNNLYPVVAFPVGIGEEAVFRGYLQSQLAEYMPPWAAIGTSSAVFGLAHIGNANNFSSRQKRFYYTIGVPYISLIGVYLGWLTNKNHSLQESVAVHAWYDFVLFLGKAVASTSKTGTLSIKDIPPIALHFSF